MERQQLSDSDPLKIIESIKQSIEILLSLKLEGDSESKQSQSMLSKKHFS